MFMNSYIHLVEASTLLLVCVLVLKIYYAYSDFYQSKQVSSDQSLVSQLDRILPLAEKKPSLAFESNKHYSEEKRSVRASISVPNVKPTEISNAEEILNDYIGEFFTETKPTIDIQAYRADVSETEALNISHQDEIIVMDTLPVGSLDVALNDSVSDNDESIEVIPVLNTLLLPELEPALPVSNVPLLESDGKNMSEDDSVITVASTQSSKLKGADNIMSDKVVHAMLDEAKLVCVS